MRRSLSLGLVLVALSALPAAARGSVHVHFGSHPHVVRHFHHFNHFKAFGFNRFNRFGNSRFFGWGDWADGDVGAGDGGPSGTVLVLAAPPTTAPPTAAPEPRASPPQATVVTEGGVTVFRGPGSHHLR